MTLSEFALVVAAIGSISGLIMFFVNRGLSSRVTIASITKTNLEIEQIEQNIKSQYALQVKTWIEDLQEIQAKHERSIAKKDADLLEIHRQHLNVVKEISEEKLKLDRYSKATRRLLVGMDIPYWECGPDGGVTYVNGAWLKLFGLQSHEAAGFQWTQAIPTEDRQKVLLEWNSRVVDHAESPFDFRIQNFVTRETINVRALYVVIFDTDDNVHKIIGITVPHTK